MLLSLKTAVVDCFHFREVFYNLLSQELKIKYKRTALIQQANDMLVNQVAVIPLVARTQPTDGISKDIQGDIPNPWDNVLWNIADWYKTGG